MYCPKCETEIVRTRYLGANVRQCERCQGFLLDKKRAERIRKRVNKDVEALTKESEATSSQDTLDSIRCPACRNEMDKVLVEGLNFHVDECDNCDKVWFDGGELARLQLAFETREQTVELNRMRERLKNMTDEERAEYEERIANLPDLGSGLEQVTSEATVQVTMFSLFGDGFLSRFWRY